MKRKLHGKTYFELLGPAMEITDQAEADEYFELLVERCLEKEPMLRSMAEAIQRDNLGYFAGYYGNDTRERVERLFKCAHPVFGKIAERGAPTPEQAFEMGMKAAMESKRRES
ncbi:MAG TPA: hypothetical protein VHA37_04395 [Candidatus Saccharimonadales bacterium]|nr:hypothetical protein [Candidatus Saccharimonadales bacterium]